MKSKLFRLLAVLLTAAAAALLFALSAWAVPAAPGAGDDAGRAACRSRTGPVVTPAALAAHGNAQKAPAADGRQTASLPLAVIVVEYDNLPYSTTYDWAQTIFTGARSLAAYYEEMSFGSFTFTPAAETSAGGVGGNRSTTDRAGDGVIHVTLAEPHQDWTLEDDSGEADYFMIRMLMRALAAAEPMMDFAAYDGNGDGTITTDELAIAFVLAGYEAAQDLSCSLGREYYLWSHAWSIDEAIGEYGWHMALPRYDGVEVSSYIAIAERLDADRQEPISVLAHELGHYLGLPDLYPTAGGGAWSAYAVNYLSLMASGAWGRDADGNYQPCAMDAWCRCTLGWHTPETAAADGIYTVRAQESAAGYAAVRIPTQRAEEYYLIENRQPTGWDYEFSRAYPQGGGLILWHVDAAVLQAYLPANGVNNPDHRPGVMPLYPEATDGVYSFLGNQKTVYTGRPFFDSAAQALNLPLYGSGGDADLRAGRFASGLLLTVLDPSAPEMRVQLETGGHLHLLQLQPAQPAGCETAGRAEAWICPYCGALFADEAGTQPTTAEALILSALGHTAPDFYGNCTRCGTHLLDVCRWCGQQHAGFPGALIGVWHSVLWFFRSLVQRLQGAA